MVLTNALLTSTVLHARQRPKRHTFLYGVYYLAFALEDMPKLSMRFLSLERWNFFSFYARDHGPKDGSSLEKWMKSLLTDWGLTEADGSIVLVTLPRIFGYVFNPVSFWFCLDRSGRVRAVLSEVCNTFGECHCYLSFHDDHRPILATDWLKAEKVFHVSPFMDMTGHYQFRFIYDDKKIGVWVNHHDSEGLMLSTSVIGTRHSLTSSTLIRSFFRYPLVTFKVIGLIHFEAFRLLLKGVRYRPKPSPPSTQVSR